MKGLVCKVCGFIAISGKAPEKCPVCGADKISFAEKEDAIKTPKDTNNLTELEKKHNKLAWEVEVVTADNKVMEVHIDAQTGAIIDVEEED